MGRETKILIIDDDVSVRQSLMFVLKDTYFLFLESDAFKGIDCLAKNKIDVVFMDIRMPRMDGIEALRVIKEIHPEVEIVMMTAHEDLDTVCKAIRYGALDYIIKPFNIKEVRLVIEKALTVRDSKKRLMSEKHKLQELNMFLESQVKQVVKDAVGFFENNILAMMRAMSFKDQYALSHLTSVSQMSAQIASKMGMSYEEIQWLQCAANIHDIGKIGIDENILVKEGRLSNEEYRKVQRHCEIGVEIISKVPILESIIPFIKYHHEWYDGKGYPDGLAGDDIPLSARIISVAEAIDSMMNSPYENRFYNCCTAEYELIRNAGKQFDPDIVDLVITEKMLN